MNQTKHKHSLTFLLVLALLQLGSACSDSTTGARQDPIDPSVSWWAWNVEYLNQTWITVGGLPPVGDADFSTPVILTSQDGQNWTQHKIAGTGSLKSVAYGNNVFVAVGGDLKIDGEGDAITTRIHMISEDGVSWETVDNSPLKGFDSITFGAGQFVATSSNSGKLVRHLSVDGRSWTETTTQTSFFQPEVIWAGDRFYVYDPIGGSFKILSSTDGITWESDDTRPNLVRFLTFSGTQLWGGGEYDCCFGESGSIQQFKITFDSTLNFQQVTSSRSIQKVAVVSDIAVALDGRDILRGKNLPNEWEWENSSAYIAAGAVGASSNAFVVGGQGLLYSENGIDWTVAEIISEE